MRAMYTLCCLSAVLVLGLAAEFDIKTYERGLKKDIPWSLTGSAQDLRSDAKHQLQLILRSVIMLRPEVPWDEKEVPTADKIAEHFKILTTYLVQEQSEEKQKWVVDSLDYILLTYLPEVQKLLDSAPVTAGQSIRIDDKKQLLKDVSERILQGENEIKAAVFRKKP